MNLPVFQRNRAPHGRSGPIPRKLRFHWTSELSPLGPRLAMSDISLEQESVRKSAHPDALIEIGRVRIGQEHAHRLGARFSAHLLHQAPANSATLKSSVDRHIG